MEEEDCDRTPPPPWDVLGRVLSEPERERVSVVVRVVARRRVGERRVVIVRMASVRIWSSEGDSSVGAELMRWSVSGRGLEGVLGAVMLIAGMLSLDEEGDIFTEVRGCSKSPRLSCLILLVIVSSEFADDAVSGAEKDLFVVSGGRVGDSD